MNLSDIFTFGKYKGVQLADVIKKDAQYIEWVVEKGIITVSDEVLEDVVESARAQYYEYLREASENEQQVEY